MIFYDFIKGMNKDDRIITKIEWPSKNLENQATPSISIDGKVFGNLLVSGTAEVTNLKQVIYSPVSFNNSVNITGDNNTINSFTLKSGKNFILEDKAKITFKTAAKDLIDLKVTHQPKKLLILTNSDLKVQDGSCEAKFFNSTSDRRAKEDLLPIAGYNALQAVQNTPIYTYHYKGHPADEISLGVMAQDVQDIKLNESDFNLVNNLNASGKDNDFMTIKESKLVYVLWSAVQTLSLQVEELQEQIKKLSNK